MQRIAVALYGVVCYILFLASFLYAIGFVGNIAVPKSIDSGAAGGFSEALLVNLVLLGLFAIQHTIMARPAFKARITRIIPAAAERSTFVLVTSLLLFLMFWKWIPMEGMVWDVSGTMGGTVLTGLFWLGWVTVLVSTFLINHFDLFGLRQVYLNYTGEAYTNPKFRMTGLYKLVRHPIMVGFVIAFWSTPVMSVGHLVFAIATTAYIVIGVTFEERDLAAIHGESYRSYQRRVPMLVPFTKRGGA